MASKSIRDFILRIFVGIRSEHNPRHFLLYYFAVCFSRKMTYIVAHFIIFYIAGNIISFNGFCDVIRGFISVIDIWINSNFDPELIMDTKLFCFRAISKKLSNLITHYLVHYTM